MVTGDFVGWERRETAERLPTSCELALASRQSLAPLLVCHRHFFDVLYEDTDATGAVYHPNYLRFLDRARAQLLGAKVLRSLQEQHGFAFLIHRAKIDFKRMATFGERLRVDTWVQLSTPHKLDFRHQIVQEAAEALVAIADVRVVCIDKQRRPQPVPLSQILETIQLAPPPNTEARA